MPSRPALHRTGFSMVELLMALALTLLMMGAVVTIFGLINTAMSDSRATVELNGRLQAAADRVQRDLDGLTLPVVPWTRPEAGQGYFEYVEGPRHDFDTPLYPQGVKREDHERDWKQPNAPLPLVGDVDDILMFTTRSRTQPFVGRQDLDPNSKNTPLTFESDVAEVIYFCAPDPTSYRLAQQLTELPTGANFAEKQANEQRREVLYTLYRQVRLVYPTTKLFDGPQRQVPSLDLSYRMETVGGENRFVLNSLADLTKRENRAYRQLKGFPFDIFPSPISPNPSFPLNPLNNEITWQYGRSPAHDRTFPGGSPSRSTESRIGLDVLLTNVLAFDVKAWDPTAVVKGNPTLGVVYQPGDPNYHAGGAGVTNISSGAYVDLFYTRRYPNPGSLAASTFSGPPNPKTRTSVPYYDTWSLHYEFDGIDQDGQFGPDQANNGIDDNANDPNNGGIDDASERETSPPYPVPLRGIQIRIRAYEPDSRQVRQVTINGDFLPE
jgi:type II secretory pathway pseudopilin PulG